MSRPAHVGESEKSLFTKLPDGRIVTDRPWPQFMVIEYEVLEKAGPELRCTTKIEGGREREYVGFKVANGCAFYRVVGHDHLCMWLVAELSGETSIYWPVDEVQSVRPE